MASFNDVFRRTSHVRFVEDIREVVSYGQMLYKTERRDWLEFCENFNLPKRNEAVIKKRVLINLLYYRVNYAMVFGTLLTMTTLFWSTSPLFLVVGSFIQAVYMFQHLYLRPLRIAGHSFNHEEKKIIFGVLMTVKIVAMELILGSSVWPSVVLTFLSMGLIGGHAALRPRSTRSRFGTMGSAASMSTVSTDVEDGGVQAERVHLYHPSATIPPASFSPPKFSTGALMSNRGQNFGNLTSSLRVDSSSNASAKTTSEDPARARNEAYAARRRQVIQKERQASRMSGLASRNMWTEESSPESAEVEVESKHEDGAGALTARSMDTDNAEREASTASGLDPAKKRPSVHLHVPARAINVDNSRQHHD
mmetsp:Transcript_910/g.2117  ORF Transcript_910/g.2117 Transcript_910/m.2117 type:complete len:365 (-) Transcript_910:88-1182(-)